MADDEEVQRTVEHVEGRALAAAGERGAFGQPRAALDITGRQGTQRAGDLRKGQVGEVASLKIPRSIRSNPAILADGREAFVELDVRAPRIFRQGRELDPGRICFAEGTCVAPLNTVAPPAAAGDEPLENPSTSNPM